MAARDGLVCFAQAHAPRGNAVGVAKPAGSKDMAVWGLLLTGCAPVYVRADHHAGASLAGFAVDEGDVAAVPPPCRRAGEPGKRGAIAASVQGGAQGWREAWVWGVSGSGRARSGVGASGGHSPRAVPRREKTAQPGVRAAAQQLG